MAAKPPFHNPFASLKIKPMEKAKPLPPVRAAEPPSDDEGALFRQAMGEVAPVRRGPQVTRVQPPPRDPRIIDPEHEALAELAELVAGNGELDLSDSDEFIEGAVPGFDAGLMRRLRRGELAVQAHLDLHGMDRAEAKEALTAFIAQSRTAHRRCVLVVHGRGLHSKDQIPVLKESIQIWLARGRMGRQVLAFTSARPHNGGAGAVYVLLRK